MAVQYQTDTQDVVRTDVTLLTLDEAVQFLGTSRPTLYRWLAQGVVKGSKVGRQWRFKQEDLTRALDHDPLSQVALPDDLLKQEIDWAESQMPARSSAAEDQEAGVGRLIHSLFRLSLHFGATDIHLEPVKRPGRLEFTVRIRVDGSLQVLRELPSALYEPIVLTLKSMAGMSLAEKRIPQDGQIEFYDNGNSLYVRTATLLTQAGECITLKLIPAQNMLIKLDKIGIAADHPLHEWLRRPSGLTIITGSGGSGKTTTVYSSVLELASQNLKTYVIGDPFQISIPFTTSIPVSGKSGLTIASALRAVGNHDPDIICLTEVPDGETARLLCDFALNGVRVIVQMSAQDAIGAVLQLDALGADPLALGMSVTGVIAQRLARRICSGCKKPANLENDHPYLMQAAARAAAIGYNLPESASYQTGSGCDQCRNTGYRGRIALYETLPWGKELLKALAAGVSRPQLDKQALVEGIRTLLSSGFDAAIAGHTSLDEALRVCV